MELKNLYQPIFKDLLQLDKEIESQITKIYEGTQDSKNYQFLKKIITHIFNNSGKHLRPALVFLSARAVNESMNDDYDSVIKFAAAVEFLHSASLIHDDIIDGSKFRRNQITLNEKYDGKIAVLVGDILYSQFFSILINLNIEDEKHEKLLHLFIEITKKMCFGEIYEHKLRDSIGDPSIEEYIEVIENKTACLIAASCQGGAILAGADKNTLLALTHYGLYLGLSYQLIDDYIDGDSILKSSAYMVEKAKEYTALIKTKLGLLKESPYRHTLHLLCDFIVEEIMDKCK